jgi:hypothetical protein
MKSFNLTKSLGLALGCAALLLTSHAASAVELRANAGTTFATEFGPGGLTHKVDGIAQVSLVGNCKVHFDLVGELPADPTQPIAAKGSLTITSANGDDTLSATVIGSVTADPANPQEFANFHYRVRFTGGTGEFEGARGIAVIKGAGVYTSQTGGTATWTMRGDILGTSHCRR